MKEMYKFLLAIYSLQLAFTQAAEKMEVDLNVVFQLSKYNDLWSKAVKLLSPIKLSQLELSLRKLDKEELALKHLQEEGKEDSELESSIQEHLAEILQLYRLEETSSTLNMDVKSPTFSDDRLENIWKTVQFESEYNESERQALFKNLLHLQETINGFQKLSAKTEKSGPSDVNSPNYQYEAAKHSKKLAEMRYKLKEEYDNINSRIQEVSKKVNKEMGESFFDQRVIDLWNKAKFSGQFNHEELKSIKDELRHFQNRIDKLVYWEKESKQLHNQIQNEGAKLKEEYDYASLKVKEYQKYVKKYYATMYSRISPRVEL